jgi:hypothetical protein
MASPLFGASMISQAPKKENTAIYRARAASFEKRKDCGKALLDYTFITKKKPIVQFVKFITLPSK